MATVTDSDLNIQFQQIRDEITPAGNSALRVYEALKNLYDTLNAGKINNTTLLSDTTSLNSVTFNGLYLVFTSNIEGLHFPDIGDPDFTGSLLVIGDTTKSAAITQILTRTGNPIKQWVRSLNHSGVEGTPVFWEDWVETTGPVPFTPLAIGTSTIWETFAGTVNNKTLLLTQNTSIAINNLVNGSRLVLVLTQDATGGRTVTLPANSLPATVTINTSPNGITKLTGDYDGVNILWQAIVY